MKKFLVSVFLLFSLTSYSQTIAIAIGGGNIVKWKFSQKQISEGEVELKFQAAIEESWHMYSQYVDDEMIATKFTFFYEGDTIVFKPSEGKSIRQYDPIFEMTLRFFEDKAIFKQRITVNSLENIQLRGYVDFIVCDESQCLPPDYSEFAFTIKGVEKVIEGRDLITFTEHTNDYIIH